MLYGGGMLFFWGAACRLRRYGRQTALLSMTIRAVIHDCQYSLNHVFNPRWFSSDKVGSNLNRKNA